MKIIKCLFATSMIFFAANCYAQETSNNPPTAETNTSTENKAYISDDLFIYMLAGPGKNYRILGSINAGDEVTLTGEEKNDYSQIIDSKNRTTWVESKYIKRTPGLRFSVAELNGKLASNEEHSQRIDSELNTASATIAALSQESEKLTNEIKILKEQLANSQAKLSNQDMDIKKEWFFNGAIVLGIGLVLGLIIPHISVRKKATMESWK